MMRLFLADLMPCGDESGLEQCQQDPDQNSPAFSASLWLTRQSEHSENGLEFSSLTSESMPLVTSLGRPNLLSEFKALLRGAGGNGNAALAFVCGPRPMIKAVERLSVEAGVTFHAETFEL